MELGEICVLYVTLLTTATWLKVIQLPIHVGVIINNYRNQNLSESLPVCLGVVLENYLQANPKQTTTFTNLLNG